MGLYHRLFSLLEEDCHVLDMKLANSSSLPTEQAEQTSIPFQKYNESIKQIERLKNDLQDAIKERSASEQLITLYTVTENSSLLPACHEAALYYKRLVTELVSIQKPCPQNMYI